MTAAPRRHLLLEAPQAPLALPADLVQEIIPDRAATKVPLAPRAIAGVITDRGRLLTVLELAQLRTEVTPSSEPVLIILTPPLGHLALRVEVPLRFAPTLPSALTEVLDPAALLAEIERQIATPRRPDGP